jgi:aryl-alcohol dehydrogenase-like predicted oxidoreductase
VTAGPRLGFGCASLGSRIAPREGLAALARAHDAGVRWYDVAPSYGDGQAEALLGEFLRGRREEVTVCTKVGILPPAPSLPKRIAKPLVRTLLSVAPGMRTAVKKHRPAAVKPPLTAAMIGDSVAASLRRLGVDRIDVLALHEAKPEEVVRDDILRACEDVVQTGKVGRISIASFEPAVRAGLSAFPLYRVVQVANNPLTPTLAALRATLPTGVETVTHTVFGAEGMIDAVAATIEARPELSAAMRTAGYEGTARAVALAFLPDYAFAANPDGVVLLSMFSARHLETNLARYARPRDDGAVLDLGAMIRQAA